MQSSGFVEANGARLFYEMKGEGQPLVLIHSGLLDSRMWDAQMEAFSKTHRVIRYDVRGHGQSSDVTEPYEDTEDLLALLNALGVEQARVLGLSMGGRIAVDFTIAHPERVTKLVLAAPAISGYPGDEEDQQDISMVKSMEAVGYIVQRERWKAVDVLMNEHPMWYLSRKKTVNACASGWACRGSAAGCSRKTSSSSTRPLITAWARSRCRRC